MDKTTILIAESDALFAHDLKITLEKAGYKIPRIAASKKEAIRAVAIKQPDLVLIDIHLAKKRDGIIAAQKIASKYDIPIIYLSNYADKDILQYAQETAPYGYIFKPCNDLHLRTSVETALQRHAAEKECFQSDTHFQLLVEHSTDGIMLVDEKGIVIEWNKAQAEISGIPREEALGRPLLTLMKEVALPDRMSDKRVAKIQNILSLLLKYGKARWLEHQHEVKFRRRSGDILYGDVHIFPIPTAKGIQLGGVTQDITIQKEAERALRASEEKLRALISHASDGILLTDTNGYVNIWNERMAEITGVSAKDAIGYPLWEIQTRLTNQSDHLKAALSERIKDYMLRLLAGEKQLITRMNEKCVRHTDGEKRVIQFSLTPVRIPSGIILSSIARDVTERVEMEANLRQSEAQHRLLMEQTPASVAIYRENTILYVNQACVNIMGAKNAEELIGREVLSFVSSADKDSLSKTFSEKYTFDAQPIEYTVHRMDGTPINILASATHIQYQGQLAVQSVFLDITERHNIEQALFESEKRYKSVVHNASLGIVSCDVDGNILDINPKMLEILGSPSAEETKKINIFRFPPLIKVGIAQQIQQSLATGKERTFEQEYTSKWGRTAFWRMHITPTIDETGKKIAQMIVEDFTNYKMAVEALQISEENFRKIYQQASDSIFIMDFDANILDTNQKACDELGYKREELQMLKVKDIVSGSYGNFRLQIEQFKAGKTYLFEALHKRKNGQTFPVEVSSSFITYGKKKAILSITRDITERKIAEEADRKHKAELQILMNLSRQLIEISGLEGTLRTILKNAVEHLRASAGTIATTSPDFAQIVLHQNLPKNTIGALQEVCILYDAKKHLCTMQKEYTVQRSLHDEGLEDCHPSVKAQFNLMLVSPLIENNNLLGYLHLYRRENNRFTEDEIQFLKTMLQQSITAIRKAHLFEETQRLAVTDALTQLYNRHQLYVLGKREFDHAQRYNQPLSALMIDADHFKRVNDIFGHATGDQVLQNLARHIQKNTREVDITGRYGGEEFVVLLPNTRCDAATKLADRLRTHINNENTATRSGNHPILTISIGVAELDEDTPTFEALLDKADAALYKAKRTGRNRVVSYKNG